MLSNYDTAKTGADHLLAVSESLDALSEIIATKASTELNLSEVARDGLANILAMLSEKICDADSMIRFAQEAREKRHE